MEVENALLKKATGYSYIEYKTTTNADGKESTTETTKIENSFPIFER